MVFGIKKKKWYMARELSRDGLSHCTKIMLRNQAFLHDSLEVISDWKKKRKQTCYAF